MTIRPALLAMLLSLTGVSAADDAADFERWEADIAAFEKADDKSPPPKHGIVFVGSSSIRLWKLPESFPDRKTINRGFGGSELADSVHFLDRLVLKHEPRIVVLYAGDNDLANGKSPQQVANDFRQFVAALRAELPETRVVYIAIKPSLQRWKLVDKVREANDLIAEIAEKEREVEFLDIFTPMLGDNGRPRPELFVEDGLHLSPAGYRLWTELLAPHLGES